MENETKKDLIADPIINAPTEVSSETLEHIQKENNKKKILIVGAKEKVSPQMLENIKEHYGDVEIEIMTREEYLKLGMDFLETVIEKEREDFELYLRRMDLQDYLPATLSVAVSPKPDFPKKIGKVNNKKLSPQQKQFEKRRRAR